MIAASYLHGGRRLPAPASARGGRRSSRHRHLTTMVPAINGWIRHTKWYVPGVVKSIWLDICQDIESIDVGPSPTPYERAEELAAVAYGAGRTWFQGEGPLIARPPAEQEHQTVVPIREAFLGHGESVAVDEAIGRISCESIAG